MRNLEKLANTLMIVGGIMIGIGLIGIIIKHSKEKEHFLVKDNYGHAYITHYIQYMGDCIVFYDNENDTEHKLCSDYKIVKI
jgi:hypothetical protein